MLKKIYLIYTEIVAIEELSLEESLLDNEKGMFRTVIDSLKNTNLTIEYFEYFDKRKTKKKLEKIIYDINKSTRDKVALLTDKKVFFEFFDGEVIVTTFKNHYQNKDNCHIIIDSNISFSSVLNNFFWAKQLALSNECSDYLVSCDIIKLLSQFIIYNNVFKIDLNLLTNGTAYKNIRSFMELANLIIEDIKIFIFYHIFTSRLGVVLKRLLEFNLNLSSKRICSEIKKEFNIESISYKYSFDRNIFNTDLNNKSFRGYKFNSNLSFNIDEEKKIKEQISLYKKLKKYNIKKEILKEIFRTNRFIKMEQALKEIDKYEKSGIDSIPLSYELFK